MRCMSCGADLPDGISFCTSCGAKMTPPAPPQQVYDPNQMYQNQSYGNPNMQYQPQQQPMPAMMNQPMQDITPISPWGYIGYNILFAIPLVGIIMLFVYAFGSNTNINVKNYARSFLIIILISIILTIVLSVLGVMSFSTLSQLSNNLIGINI